MLLEGLCLVCFAELEVLDDCTLVEGADGKELLSTRISAKLSYLFAVIAGSRGPLSTSLHDRFGPKPHFKAGAGFWPTPTILPSPISLGLTPTRARPVWARHPR